MPPPPHLRNVLDRLSGVRPSGDGFAAKCPAHPDSNPSLSASLGNKGAVVLNCHKGCELPEILGAIGMAPEDLWPDGGKREESVYTFVESYNYTDAEGRLVFQVNRYKDQYGAKSFRQRRPDPERQGKWINSTTGIDKPLYRLPAVLAAKEREETIWVVEGEKDVHTLESQLKVATCNAGGAGTPGSSKWTAEHTETLRGAKVVICPDRDVPGTRHARTLVEELTGVAKSIEVLRVPEPHKDVSDLIEAGGTLDDLEPFDPFEEPEPDPFRELLSEIRELGDKNWSLDRKLTKAKALLESIGVETPEPPGRLVRWEEFFAEADDDSYDWVIPNLLERTDRVILVAAEGAGKSMMMRQVAIMSAAGIHPFTRSSMDPIRTLQVDLENPERIIRRTARRIGIQVERLRPHMKGKQESYLHTRQAGLNLLGSAKDREWLEDLVDELRPDLLLIGPLYKAYISDGRRQADSEGTEVAQYFDYLRTQYNCALWLEHHAPLGSGGSRDLRPFGTSVWSRWPEFGIALAPDPTTPNTYELKHFRGQRDERAWPQSLRRGEIWPFEAIV